MLNNLTGTIILVALVLVVIIVSATHPSLLSDENAFLHDFISSQILGILGVIVAITAASASSVHLELRRMEHDYRARDAFASTRNEVKRGAFALLYLFGLAFVLVVAKPIIGHNSHTIALLNGLGCVIVVWNIMVLVALLQTAFTVGPIHFDES